MRFLALWLFLPSLALAGEWTPADTVRQGIVTGFLIADWAQTRWIVHKGFETVDESNIYSHKTTTYERHSEINPLLGNHPTMGKVNNYFAASIVGHAAISYVLPRPWREGWQYVWIGIEANQVRRNHRIGIKMNF